jgi:hypothetical protein
VVGDSSRHSASVGGLIKHTGDAGRIADVSNGAGPREGSAVVGMVGITAVDPAKQVELPLIERIPSLHHPTVRARCTRSD